MTNVLKVPFRKLKHIHHISDIQIRNLKRHREYEEVFEFYKDKSPNLGIRFSEELLDYLEKIETNPKLFQAEDSLYRRAHLQRFPYTIFYKILEEEKKVEVVAIWPQAGRQGGWKPRSD